MHKILGLALLMIGAAANCLAGVIATPEIDPASGVAAIVVLAGGLLVIRSRRKK